MQSQKSTKYIFVTGGVVSGLGKGITAAAIGNILSARGLKVGMQKCDAYLNFDAGTLNPAEHGEVFVTADGGETDLDLGHYERFIDRQLTKKSSTMAGSVYSKVIADERSGVYLGKTVQIIPHITSEIQRRIIDSAKGNDVHIVEIGGSVGDIEAMAFIEAIRQIKHRVGVDNVFYVHLVFLPYIAASKELKTKPAQNSVRDLREAGIAVDLLCVRSDHALTAGVFDKLSLYSDLHKDAIIGLPTASTVYEVPLRMEEANVGQYITSKLKLPQKTPKLASWKKLVDQIKSTKKSINIGVVAKYLNHEDTYMSVFEALRAAGWQHNVNVGITWVDAEKLEYSPSQLANLDGMVIPGGFGSRGVEGKIIAARFARENNIPFLGLCLGMQVAVIEFARHKAGLTGANSTEFDPDTKYPVIDIMPDQVGVEMGGTMRLGDYPTKLLNGSHAHKAYGTIKIIERHRHRFEFNNEYRKKLSKLGLTISGQSPSGKLVEIVELADHPFYLASQFHPEFTSRPNRANPLFVSFVAAAIAQATIETKSRKSNIITAGEII